MVRQGLLQVFAIACVLILIITQQYIGLSALYRNINITNIVQTNVKFVNGNGEESNASRYTSSKSKSSTPIIKDFPSNGTLNTDPAFHYQCVTVRFRGDENNYTVDDAMSLLTQKFKMNPGLRSLKMGIMFMEDISKFFPVRNYESGNVYHMYHFIELMVMAYVELIRLSSTLPVIAGNNDDNNIATSPTSLAKGSVNIQVPWLFSPFMSPGELCGGRNNLNCIIADLIFHGSKSSTFTDHTGIVGWDKMEQPMTNKKEDAGRRIEFFQQMNGNHTLLLDHDPATAADGVILIERFGCNMGGINKPWSRYIDSFSPYAWHSDLLLGLGRTWENPLESSSLSSTSPKRKFVLAYIDRQNTDRRIPDEHHDWLISYISGLQNVDFRHLHMEDYDGVQQIEIASECDMIVGGHGNGMTHTLWMQPNRYVIEFFWRYAFQYDFATISHLMNHTYMSILNGKVVDPTILENRDPILRQGPARYAARSAPIEESMQAFETEGKVGIQRFIEKAISELNL